LAFDASLMEEARVLGGMKGQWLGLKNPCEIVEDDKDSRDSTKETKRLKIRWEPNEAERWTF
jgi:hypothetical protein